MAHPAFLSPPPLFPATLFVVGAYHIGKERAYLGAAAALGWRVHCSPAKARVRGCGRSLSSALSDPHACCVASLSASMCAQLPTHAPRRRPPMRSCCACWASRPSGWSSSLTARKTPRQGVPRSCSLAGLERIAASPVRGLSSRRHTACCGCPTSPLIGWPSQCLFLADSCPLHGRAAARAGAGRPHRGHRMEASGGTEADRCAAAVCSGAALPSATAQLTCTRATRTKLATRADAALPTHPPNRGCRTDPALPCPATTAPTYMPQAGPGGPGEGWMCAPPAT